MTDQPRNVQTASIDPNADTPAPAGSVDRVMNQPLTQVSDDATDQSADPSLSQANDIVLGQTMTNAQDGNPQLAKNPAEGQTGESSLVEDQSVENRPSNDQLGDNQPSDDQRADAQPANSQPADDQPDDDPLARLDELLAKAKAKRSSAPSGNRQINAVEDDKQSSAEEAADKLAQKALKEEEAKQAEIMAQQAEQQRQAQLAAQQAKMAELEETDQFKARVQQGEGKKAAETQLAQEHAGHDILQVTEMKVTK